MCVLIFCSIEYLAAKANSLISDVSGDSMSDLVEKLLFTDEQWESALRPFLGAVKNLSLAITNPLGGSIFLVNNDSPTDAESAWDTDGYSTVLRMAMFAMKFVEGLEDTPNIISSKTKGILLRHILLVQELLKDKLSVAHANDIWKENSPEVEAEIIEFTSSTQQWAVSALNSDIPQHEFAPALVDKLLERCGGSSAAAFYSARALYVAMSDLCENDQFFRDKAVAWTDANDIWNNEDVFGSVGMLAGSASILTHSKKERIWTGLIGSLLGVSSANAGTKGLQQLVLLNAALPSADEGAAPLPQPRAMNLIRHLLSWVDEENEEIELSPGLIVEISKALCSILKIVKGMYGGHWQSAFDFMKGCWEVCRYFQP